MSLWNAESENAWAVALASYARVIAAQGVKALPALDEWYRDELPTLIDAREPPRIVHEELVRVTEWKMARGVWRARNLALVRGNTPERVEAVSARALATIPDPAAPARELSSLSGVGPATASAVASAASPTTYPFLDELVAAQVPGLGKPAFTPVYYARYATALRQRAERLGTPWTPTAVERALWASVGGKAGRV